MPRQAHSTRGVISAIVANIFLGLSSLFWKQLGALDAIALVGYRVFLSLATVAIILMVLRKFRGFFLHLDVRTIAVHVGAALLVSLNWGVFIWASIHGEILESGLGYLIAPCVSIAAGVFVYKDALSRVKSVAISLITLCIFYSLYNNGTLDPWVYLTIGITWGLYACLKKITRLNAFEGLFLESLVLALLFVPILIFSRVSWALPAAFGPVDIYLLLLCGLISIIPLALFSFAAGKLPISALGLLQFVLPITQFITAVLIYHQPASITSIVTFILIGGALLAVLVEQPIKVLFNYQKGIHDESGI